MLIGIQCDAKGFGAGPLLPESAATHSQIETGERTPLYAGHGACKSCNCSGYIPAKPNYCKCGHHFSQHA
jgi:hypothetical protein